MLLLQLLSGSCLLLLVALQNQLSRIQLRLLHGELLHQCLRPLSVGLDIGPLAEQPDDLRLLLLNLLAERLHLPLKRLSGTLLLSFLRLELQDRLVERLKAADGLPQLFPSLLNLRGQSVPPLSLLLLARFQRPDLFKQKFCLAEELLAGKSGRVHLIAEGGHPSGILLQLCLQLLIALLRLPELSAGFLQLILRNAQLFIRVLKGRL